MMFSSRVFFLLCMLTCAYSAYATGYIVNGNVVDPSGSSLSQVSVQLSMIGVVGGGPVEPLTGITDSFGRFVVLVPTSGNYRVCTSGAAAPLLNLCSAAAEHHLYVSEGASIVPLEISLQKGIKLLVSLNDKYSRLSSLKIEATLSVDPFLIASPSAETVSDISHRFMFSVPVNSDGALILTSIADGFFDVSGTFIPVGVPALRWSVGTQDAQLELQLK